MAIQSIIVMDGTLADSVAEYSAVIDYINQNEEFSSSIKEFISIENNEIFNEESLAKSILGSAKLLGKLQDKEFEPTVNLVFNILSLINESNFESNLSNLITDLVSLNPAEQPSFRDKKSLRTTSIISSITNIFNIIPSSSNLRAVILVELINLSKSLNFQVIKPIGVNLISWLQQAGVPAQQISSIFWEFIYLDTSFTKDSLLLIKSYSNQFEISVTDLHKIIKFSLSSNIVDLAFILTKSIEISIAKNSSDEFVKLFSGYINGNLSTFNSISGATYQSNGFDQSVIFAKAQILALAVFVASKDVVSYEEISKELSIKKDDVEELLISAISGKVLEGRLNQLNESFSIHRVNQIGSVNSKENWIKIQKSLESWKDSLKDIREIVEISRQKSLNNFATAK